MLIDLKMWCVLIELEPGDFPHGASDDEIGTEVRQLMRSAGRDPDAHRGQYHDAVKAVRGALDDRDGPASLVKRLSMLGRE